jgi:hypothetical protein
MPYQTRIKRSETPGAVPSVLGYGELAFNFADRVLYIGDRDGNAIPVSPAEIVGVPPEIIDPVPPPQQPGYTTNGVRRRLLPFEE